MQQGFDDDSELFAAAAARFQRPHSTAWHPRPNPPWWTCAWPSSALGRTS